MNYGLMLVLPASFLTTCQQESPSTVAPSESKQQVGFYAGLPDGVYRMSTLFDAAHPAKDELLLAAVHALGTVGHSVFDADETVSDDELLRIMRLKHPSFRLIEQSLAPQHRLGTVQLRGRDFFAEGSVRMESGQAGPFMQGVVRGVLYQGVFSASGSGSALQREVWIRDVDDPKAYMLGGLQIADEAYRRASLLTKLLEASFEIGNPIDSLDDGALKGTDDTLWDAHLTANDAGGWSRVWHALGVNHLQPGNAVSLFAQSLVCSLRRAGETELEWTEEWRDAFDAPVVRIVLRWRAPQTLSRVVRTWYLPGTSIAILRADLTISRDEAASSMPWEGWSQKEGDRVHDMRRR